MYHIECPAKYRRAVITKEVDGKLREIYLGIEARYEIKFLEIGTEKTMYIFWFNRSQHTVREDSADNKKSNGEEDIRKMSRSEKDVMGRDIMWGQSGSMGMNR
jgi:hypothetical protein